MNIYKIIFSHHSPKDSEIGIKYLLLAENDEHVYNWIKSKNDLYTSWEDNEEYLWNGVVDSFVDKEGNEVDEGWWDEEGNPENFKDRMLRLQGELEDDSIDFSDAYYGITLIGWELIKENIESDYTELIEAGIVFKTC